MNKINCIKRKLCSKSYFYPKFDKKMLRIKKSFDEVNGFCNKRCFDEVDCICSKKK